MKNCLGAGHVLGWRLRRYEERNDGPESTGLRTRGQSSTLRQGSGVGSSLYRLEGAVKLAGRKGRARKRDLKCFG